MGLGDFEFVSIEDVQAYWEARPCNLRHSVKPLGSRAYFDEVEERKYLVEPHIPAFADFPRWNGKRVLEIGCGIGTDTINFARAGARVTAVDLSENSLALARKRSAIFGVADRIRFYQADAERLSATVPAETYDLVYSFGVIYHSPHPDRILGEIHNYLAPSGTLKLMVYHRYSWKVLSIVTLQGRGRFWDAEKIVARHSEAQTGCPVTYTYSRSDASRLLEANGYKVVEMRADHIFPYRIPDYVQYRYRKQRHFEHMPLAWFRSLERALGWHLLITAEHT